MKALNGGQQDLLPAGERIDEPHNGSAMLSIMRHKTILSPISKPTCTIGSGGGRAPIHPILCWCMVNAHARWYDFIAPLLTPIIMLFRSTCRAWAIARLAAGI